MPQSDPARIFLQPECCVGPNEARQWCEHDVWGDDCDDHKLASVYISATDRLPAREVTETEADGWETGMRYAAAICATLAETTYDDADAFEAACGCEAAIIKDLGIHRRCRSTALTAALGQESE